MSFPSANVTLLWLRHKTDDVDIYLFDVAAMTVVSKRIPGAFEHIGIWLLGLMKIFIVKQ